MTSAGFKEGLHYIESVQAATEKNHEDEADPDSSSRKNV